MLASEHAETQQDGVLDGIDQYQLPQSTVTKIAKAAVCIQLGELEASFIKASVHP